MAATDKFRDSASAAEVAAAVGRACRQAGWDCDEVPLADGGEGLLDVLGGANRSAVVTGPLGAPVEAEWRLAEDTAVIEMARASGLVLAGGPDGNDPVDATTAGTGELIRHAVEAGARRVIVGLGGSATTDGGLGALQAIYPTQRLRGVELIVACDVRTPFLEAATVFGPQKGASPAQVRLLANRLNRLVGLYEEEHGVDVRGLVGAGAAGGLAGGLAAIGGVLVDGFSLVSDELGLDLLVEGADLVVTGEGLLDLASFEGKVVGGVAELARSLGVRTVAVVGQCEDSPGLEDVVAASGLEAVVSLVEQCGHERAFADAASCVEELVAGVLAGWADRPTSGG